MNNPFVDWFLKIFMLFLETIGFTVGVWTAIFFPFFYLWLIPFWISCFIGYKKKNWKIPFLTFIWNIAASLVIAFVVLCIIAPGLN